VVAAHRLKFKHHFCQPFGLLFRAGFVLAYIVVLAKAAAEIAPSEEDRATAAPTAKTVLFTEVRKVTAHSCISARLTYLLFVLQSIDVAMPSTDSASLQIGQCGFDAPF